MVETKIIKKLPVSKEKMEQFRKHLLQSKFQSAFQKIEDLLQKLPTAQQVLDARDEDKDIYIPDTDSFFPCKAYGDTERAGTRILFDLLKKGLIPENADDDDFFEDEEQENAYQKVMDLNFPTPNFQAIPVHICSERQTSPTVNFSRVLCFPRTGRPAACRTAS